MNVNDKNGGIAPYKFYVFGSFLREINPLDVDILIVYDQTRVTITTVLQLRRQLCTAFNLKFRIALDVCLLSLKETAGNRFITDENAELILG